MKNISARSLMDIRFLSALSVSPDGQYTAWVECKCDEKKNAYQGNIRMRDNQTGKITQLTSGGKEFSFIWDDRETILFAAERCEEDKPKDAYFDRTAFYRLNVLGGEAVRAFAVDQAASGITKVGEGLYCLECVVDLNKPAEKDEDFNDYHVFEEVPFWGNGRGFIAGKRNSLFLYDEKTGSMKKITPDYFDVSSYDVRDGRILYAGQEYREMISIYDTARVYTVKDGQTASLLPDGQFAVRAAKLTESGVLLAMSDLKPFGTGQLSDFYRCGFGGENLRKVWATENGLLIGEAASCDCQYGRGTAMEIVGDEAYFVGLTRYRQEIWHLDSQNQVKKITELGSNVAALSVSAGRLFCVAQAENALDEIWEVKEGTMTPVTDCNGPFLREHDVAKVEYLPFTDTAGDLVDGWVLKPADFDPEEKYPAVLEIHGGPRGAYTVSFFHEMQALAGNGYIVFFCNPHGSEGYGEVFGDLRGQYGQIDYEDLMQFTDHVLKNVPQIDEKRLGVAGGSYGGFMCNWIEGHTDRFAAIASQRSISNWVADFGSSEIGVTFDRNEMGADPWTDMEKMWAQSPLKFADQARTPILFIHSLCDYNCTIDQGVEMFAAMKHFGVPSRMCVFEGENHSLSRSGKPRHRLRRLDEIIGWFDRYLKA